MAYASRSGRARTSVSSPQAHAICDRCGFRYNWVDLRWQYDWRGSTMQNIKILVCKTCYDKPQDQLRAIVLPADPTPIVNARIQDFTNASSDYFSIVNPINSSGGTVTAGTESLLFFSDGNYLGFNVGQTLKGGTLLPNTKILAGDGPFVITDQNYSSWGPEADPVMAIDPVTGLVVQVNINIVTENDQNITKQPIGAPVGLDPNAVMPLYGKDHYRVPLSVLSISSNGNYTVTVTCDSPHNLSTGDQVGIYNLLNSLAEGMFSVNVTSATAFTYTTEVTIPSGGISSSYTKVFTVLVKLPYGYTEIPQTGLPEIQ